MSDRIQDIRDRFEDRERFNSDDIFDLLTEVDRLQEAERYAIVAWADCDDLLETAEHTNEALHARVTELELENQRLRTGLAEADKIAARLTDCQVNVVQILEEKDEVLQLIENLAAADPMSYWEEGTVVHMRCSLCDWSSEEDEGLADSHTTTCVWYQAKQHVEGHG